MARQKVAADKVERKPADWDGSDPQETSSSSESDLDEDEFPTLSHEQVYEMGQSAEKAEDLDGALRYFEAAVRKLVQSEGREVTPRLADYWLAYGHVLLKKEEESADLFTSGATTEAQEDSKKIAWESLDVARLCFEMKLREMEIGGKLGREAVPNGWGLIATSVKSKLLPWSPAENASEEVANTLKNASFTRLRLGDFCQGHHRHEDAAEDFFQALKLCIEYSCPVSEALSAAIPLAQCLMATDDDKTELAFSFALLLIDTELITADNSSPRHMLLAETRNDLASQIQEYMAYRESVKEEAKKALAEAQLIAPPTPSLGDVLDLGHLGKKRKK